MNRQKITDTITIRNLWITLGILCLIFLASSTYIQAMLTYAFYGFGKYFKHQAELIWIKSLISYGSMLLLTIVAFSKLKRTILLWLVLLINTLYLYSSLKYLYIGLFKASKSMFGGVSAIVNYITLFSGAIIPILCLILLGYYLYRHFKAAPN